VSGPLGGLDLAVRTARTRIAILRADDLSALSTETSFAGTTLHSDFDRGLRMPGGPVEGAMNVSDPDYWHFLRSASGGCRRLGPNVRRSRDRGWRTALERRPLLVRAVREGTVAKLVTQQLRDQQ
jgi:hypothetical protein